MKAAASPGVRAAKKQLESNAALDHSKCTPYRAVVARSNYLASDRPELQFSAYGVCRWVSSPTDLSLAGLERHSRQSGRLISECILDGGKVVATPGVKTPGVTLTELEADIELATKLHTASRKIGEATTPRLIV